MAAPDHDHQTRKKANSVFTLKHPLQQKRDNYGAKIKHVWLPQAGRPHLEPRSIRLPTGACRARCFQNVVHQSLMHVPKFLHWILSHTGCDIPTNDCVMCLYRDFVARYWQDAAAADIVVPANDPSLNQIAVLAKTARPAAFTSLGDTAEFYEWIVEQLLHTKPIGGWARKHWRELLWNREWEAMFLLDYSESKRCPACLSVDKQDNWESKIQVALDPAMADLDQILDSGFFNQTQSHQCGTCNAAGEHRVRRRIKAAPQVLRIEVQLATTVAGQVMKQLHPWDVPELLDLTQYQLNAELPLQYNLSSAIAHAGSNGHQEVGGVARATKGESSESSGLDDDELEKYIPPFIDVTQAVEEEDDEEYDEEEEINGLDDDECEEIIPRFIDLTEAEGEGSESSSSDEDEDDEEEEISGPDDDAIQESIRRAMGLTEAVEQERENSSSEEDEYDEEEESSDEEDNDESYYHEDGDSDDGEAPRGPQSPGNGVSQEPEDEDMSYDQELLDEDSPTEEDASLVDGPENDETQPLEGQENMINSQAIREEVREAVLDSIMSTLNEPIKEVPGFQQLQEYMQQQTDARVQEHIDGRSSRSTSRTPSLGTEDDAEESIYSPSVHSPSRTLSFGTADALEEHVDDRSSRSTSRTLSLGTADAPEESITVPQTHTRARTLSLGSTDSSDDTPEEIVPGPRTRPPTQRTLSLGSVEALDDTPDESFKDPNVRSSSRALNWGAVDAPEENVAGPIARKRSRTASIHAAPEETVDDRNTRTRSRTLNIRAQSPPTPDQSRPKRRCINVLRGLVEVTNEAYINEIGPDLTDLPYTPSAPRKRRCRALYKMENGYLTPSPRYDDPIFPHPSPIAPTIHSPTVPNNGWILGPRRANGSEYRNGNRYWSLSPAPVRDGTHTVNVRGKNGEFHVGNGDVGGAPHVVLLAPGKLGDNPQRPEHGCYRPTGYQVVVLTYTRRKLPGVMGKFERDIPGFER
ncbi:hypothetical protein CC86DRAFT_406693 [Ophiobolus disseminans]|uniref:USP domain-containing protein n=1 Tax=Ophiobolus disseminans TaxID=1469910 RepID=A0A6A6ZZD1_9PLEO|nr:hypothetical protein CC86DRAFT_406693 [Ophiobolus disseminans]